jgi:hypothetical protein
MVGKSHLDFRFEEQVESEMEPHDSRVEEISESIQDASEVLNYPMVDQELDDGLINLDYETVEVDDESMAKAVESSNMVTRFISGYLASYRNGVKRYGVWWKIFQLSIWSIALILVTTACIIFVFYLPKIEMIKWTIEQ